MEKGPDILVWHHETIFRWWEGADQVTDLHVDDAEVCPQFKCHVKHIHLRSKSKAWAQGTIIWRKLCLWQTLHRIVMILQGYIKIKCLEWCTWQKNASYLVENDHHVANVIAVCVKTIRISSSVANKNYSRIKTQTLASLIQVTIDIDNYKTLITPKTKMLSSCSLPSTWSVMIETLPE